MYGNILEGVRVGFLASCILAAVLLFLVLIV